MVSLKNQESINNRSKVNFITKYFSQFSLIFIFIIIFIIFSIANKSFFTFNNLIVIGFSFPIQGIVAIFMTLLIISGNLDLSVGSVISFSGSLIAVLLMDLKLNENLSILIVLAVGLIIGIINGLFVAYLRQNSVIVTLAMLFLLKGFSYILIGRGGQSKSIGVGLFERNIFSMFRIIGRGSLFGIPISLIIVLILFIIFSIILNKTAFGREIFSIGGNLRTAIFSGINVKSDLLTLFIFSSLLSALAGIIFASRLSGGLPNAGDGYELSIITAVLLGGTSLAGGRGTLLGTFLGVLLIEVLRHGLEVVHVGTFWQYFLIGVLLIVAVLLDKIKTKIIKI